LGGWRSITQIFKIYANGCIVFSVFAVFLVDVYCVLSVSNCLLFRTINRAMLSVLLLLFVLAVGPFAACPLLSAAPGASRRTGTTVARPLLSAVPSVPRRTNCRATSDSAVAQRIGKESDSVPALVLRRRLKGLAHTLFGRKVRPGGELAFEASYVPPARRG
jgi:hypothetical protein